MPIPNLSVSFPWVEGHEVKKRPAQALIPNADVEDDEGRLPQEKRRASNLQAGCAAPKGAALCVMREVPAQPPAPLDFKALMAEV